jgi:hypothetical protein
MRRKMYLEFLEIYIDRLQRFNKDPVNNKVDIEMTIMCINITLKALKAMEAEGVGDD